MVICAIPAFGSNENSDTSTGIKIKVDNTDIPIINAASKKKAKKKVIKKAKAKKVVKKVKLKRYKVKVRYFYKGKWRIKYVYRYYSTPVYKAPAPAPVIRDVPYWECYGPTANCPSNDPRIIAKMHELTTKIVTKPNPNPRPENPDEPNQSDYIDENSFNTAHTNWLNSEPDRNDIQFNDNGTFNETAYNAAHTDWVTLEPQRNDYIDETAFNNAYSNYLAAKSAYDNYNDTITVEENLTDYEKSVNIYNYARDVEYSFYYDTRRGAINTMYDRYGNCCDITHLLIALSRAAGIPARYINADCTFLSGSRIGHVWAEVWLNGRWYIADASNDINDFGVIRNWNTGTMYLKGIFSSLPF